MSNPFNYFILLTAIFISKLTNAQIKTRLTFDSNPTYDTCQGPATNNLGAFYIDYELLLNVNTTDEHVINEYNHFKIKYTSAKGINDFSVFSVDTVYRLKDFYIKAKIIKPNGSIQIIEKPEPINKACEKRSDYSVKIPNIEVNDIVEVITYSTSEASNISSRLYMNKELYCSKSKINITLRKNEIPSIKIYNNFQEPSILRNKDIELITYSWTGTDISELPNEDYFIKYYTIPYMIFTTSIFNYNGMIMGSATDETWENLIDYYFTYNKHSTSDYKDLKQFIETRYEKITPELSADSKIAIIAKLQNYINDSIEIIYNDRFNSTVPLSFSLRKKRMSIASQIKFYNALFKILNIEKNFGMVLNRSSGNIDLTAPTNGSISNFIIKFKMEGLDYYIGIKLDNSYGLNEIPYEVQGTYAVMILDLEEKTYKKQLIPWTDRNSNSIKNKLIATIDLNSSSIQSVGSCNYSGATGTKFRTDLNDYQLINYSNHECMGNYLKDKMHLPSLDSFNINQDKKNIPPFITNVSYNQSLQTKNIITVNPLENALNLKTILVNNIINQPTQERKTDYFFDYPYSDEQKIYLNFKQKIVSQDLALISINYSNELGTYNFTAKQINDNTILITSRYELLLTELKKDKANLVSELNNAYNKAIEQLLKFKILE